MKCGLLTGHSPAKKTACVKRWMRRRKSEERYLYMYVLKTARRRWRENKSIIRRKAWELWAKRLGWMYIWIYQSIKKLLNFKDVEVAKKFFIWFRKELMCISCMQISHKNTEFPLPLVPVQLFHTPDSRSRLPAEVPLPKDACQNLEKIVSSWYIEEKNEVRLCSLEMFSD